MKYSQKLNYLQDNHFSDWLSTRSKIADKMSAEHPTFCVCGRLATGFHESSCRKFNEKVNKETIKELKHLFE